MEQVLTLIRTLKMTKPRLREVKKLAQAHVINKRQGQAGA